MGIVTWIELRCDKCTDVLDGLHFQGDIDGPGLRAMAHRWGWTRIKTDEGMQDLLSGFSHLSDTTAVASIKVQASSAVRSG